MQNTVTFLYILEHEKNITMKIFMHKICPKYVG